MKSKLLASTLLTFTTIIGYSSSSFAEEYQVSGTVDTENITSTLQIGNIDLIISNAASGEIVFEEIDGSLVGNVIGTGGFGVTLLSHVARFSQGHSFVTNNDTAEVAGIRESLDDGTPCSFYIIENITDISRGTKFFKNVTSVDIDGIGFIDTCPENSGNHFDLVGTVTIEE